MQVYAHKQPMSASRGKAVRSLRLLSGQSGAVSSMLQRQRSSDNRQAQLITRVPDVVSSADAPLFEQNLPLVTLNRATETVIQRQQASEQTPDTVTTPATQQHPDCYGRDTMPQAEIERRLTVYRDFVRGISGEIPQRNSILNAMCAFSLTQLNQMMQAGVRFWPPGPLPTFSENFEISIPRRGLSSYVPAIRLIRLSSNRISVLRHELAHAWDHVRGMRRRYRIDNLSDRRLERSLTGPQRLGSEMNTRHRITVGGNVLRMSIQEMYDAYRQRMRGRPREMAFGTPSARIGYSLSNVRDFYAEGYAVFNSGGLRDSQQRMRNFAPELYAYFHQEAVRYRLPVP